MKLRLSRFRRGGRSFALWSYTGTVERRFRPAIQANN